MTAPVFDASYFASGNYADYSDRRDRYLRTAAEIASLLDQLGMARRGRPHWILDYGCGPGYLLEGFRSLGYSTLGVDCSPWAREQVAALNLRVYADANDLPVPAVIMTALDVFEHMTDAAIIAAIRAVNPRVIVARIPCSTDGGQTFHLAVSRRDPTHTNCKTKEQWEAMFADLGYLTMRLQLFTVYDTDGVACLLAVRK